MSGVIAVAIYGAIGVALMSIYVIWEERENKRRKKLERERAKYSYYNGKRYYIITSKGR